MQLPNIAKLQGVVEWIFCRWPHIQEQQECYSDALYLWNLRIKTYLKKFKVVTVSETLQRRGIYVARKEDMMIVVLICWGMVNYKPVSNHGEDEFSMLDHAEELRKQFSSSKNCQNADLVKILINKTFPDCRLIEEMLLISDVVEKYPLLCSEEKDSIKLF